MNPGTYPGVQMAAYLATPAVSASLVLDCLERCPRAAWFNSWLNPKLDVEKSNKAQDAGSIAHAILLEGNADCVAVIDPRDYPGETKPYNIPQGWTNKAIRAARDLAIAHGKIPWLKDDMAEVYAMVDAAREYIDSLKATEPAIWAMFQPGGGDSELTLVWDDAGTRCRIRPDRISKDRKIIGDYKTGGTTAEPGTWGRTQMVKMGYYVAAAFYRRGCRALFNTEPDYVYLVQEQEKPYLCSLVGIDPAGYELGARRADRGLRTWRDCAKNGRWPGYPARVCYAEIPAWEMARGEEEEPLGNATDGERYGRMMQIPGAAREEDPAYP